MKLAIASLIVGSAAAFQPHTALNAVPKSSSALDMKVRFRFPLPFPYDIEKEVVLLYVEDEIWVVVTLELGELLVDHERHNLKDLNQFDFSN